MVIVFWKRSIIIDSSFIGLIYFDKRGWLDPKVFGVWGGPRDTSLNPLGPFGLHFYTGRNNYTLTTGSKFHLNLDKPKSCLAGDCE